MKMNKVAMAVAFTAALSSMSVLAADTTTGKIEFQGELVNTACGLAPNSSPVIVDFGQVRFQHWRAVIMQETYIRTSNCSIATPPWRPLP